MTPHPPSHHAGGTIRIALLAHHTLHVEAIRHLVADHADLELTGTMARGAALVELVQRERPQVAVLALAGASVDELGLIHRIATLGPETRVLLLASDNNQRTALRMLRAGARGILTPDHSPAKLVTAIRAVHRGELYLTPELERACAERYLGDDADAAPEERLSDREFQVMRLLAQGHTNREIAAQLGVGVKTIDTHRANLLRKLELRNNADLARFAVCNGIVDC